MTPTNPAIYFCSGESLEEAIKASGTDEHQLLVLQLSRREIESGLIGDAVDRLMTLSDSREYTLAFTDSMVLSVDGYVDDPRELFEIAEVVAFFRAITNEWPYWLHFVAKFPETLSVILNLLVDIEIVTRVDTNIGTRALESDGYQRTLSRLFDAMNVQYRQHGLSDDAAIAMTDKVMATFEQIIDQEPR